MRRGGGGVREEGGEDDGSGRVGCLGRGVERWEIYCESQAFLLCVAERTNGRRRAESDLPSFCLSVASFHPRSFPPVQVYAQLKRQGYIVHRAPSHLPTFLQPTAVPAFPTNLPSSSFPRSIAAVGLSLSRNIRGLLAGTWRSLFRLGSWLWRSTFGRIRLGRQVLLDEEKGDAVEVDPWTPLIQRRKEVPRNYGQ